MPHGIGEFLTALEMGLLLVGSQAPITSLGGRWFADVGYGIVKQPHALRSTGVPIDRRHSFDCFLNNDL